MNRLVPILTVVAAIVAIWYVATVGMNAQWARDQAAISSSSTKTWPSSTHERNPGNVSLLLYSLTPVSRR